MRCNTNATHSVISSDHWNTSDSVVLRYLLEIALRMRADRADLRGLVRLADIAAVEALPDDLLALLEHLVLLDVLEQELIALLMLLLDLRNALEELSPESITGSIP